MKVLITGANGFIGKNLVSHLESIPDLSVLTFNRNDSLDKLPEVINQSDLIVHLAGVNRPQKNEEFRKINVELTRLVCDMAGNSGKKIPVIFSSSTQSGNETPYGKSKKEAEKILLEYAGKTGSPIKIYQFPGIMGKWCKPDYNSVVATFCHHIAHGLPITIDDEEKEISLIYIDDLVESIVNLITNTALLQNNEQFIDIEPVYTITLGKLADQITQFREEREDLEVDEVGTGFKRALYATYISFLEEKDFSYTLPANADNRGIFVEFLKTKNSGQVSFFTALPGESRGKHYHHTKTEKFLVVQGQARFKFSQLFTGKFVQIDVTSDLPTVVESIPGWVHDVTNTGESALIVMLWSSEVFDRDRPDTISREIEDE